MLRLLITITLFISIGYAQTSKIVWMNYSATGCITCHRIASVKMNDTLYIFGTFHYNNKLNPFLIAVDSALNIKWYKAFSHNLDNLAIDKIVKINDSLIAISGGHSPLDGKCPNYNCSFVGLFNVKNQNFIWSKYRVGGSGVGLSVVGLDFDGKNLIFSAQSNTNNNGSWIFKTDLSGNILWQKLIWTGWEFNTMDIAFDGSNYVSLFYTYSSGNPTIIKFDTLGNFLWAKSYEFGYSESAYRIIADNNSYVVVVLGCNNPCGGDLNIIVFKTDTSGNILWSKSYSSNVAGWASEDRAYNIAFDYDGNYLVSGFIRASSSSSYPIVLKINRNNGSLIWSRVWNTPPPNTSSNEAKGIISIGQGKFYLLTFVGNGTDASGGFAIIREDTSLSSACTSSSSTFNESSITPSVSNLTPSLQDANYSLNDLAFSSYIPNINQQSGCEITSNYEFYKSCSFEIKGNRGYIDIKLKERNSVIIYDIVGNVVYSEFFEGERKVKVKNGIYIIKVGREKVKIIVK